MALLALLFVSSFALAETYTDTTVPTDPSFNIDTDTEFNITNSATYDGTITGGTITKTGAGTLSLTNNISAATVTSNAGTLVLGTTGNSINIGSGTNIKTSGGTIKVDGNIFVTSGHLYASGDWTTGTGKITVNSGTQLRVGGTIGLANGITLAGGLLFNDGDTNHGGTKDGTVSCPITVTADSQVQCGWKNGSLTLSGGLNGSGNLTFNKDASNPGNWINISGTGNYQGSITLKGKIRIGAEGANIGTETNPASATSYIGSKEITFNGGTLHNFDSHLTFSNDLNFTGDSYFMAGWKKNMTFTGKIKGSGNLTVFSDSGWVIMGTSSTSENPYTGDITIDWASTSKMGQVRLAADQPFGVNAGEGKIYGKLDMNGYSQTFKGLTNDGDKGSIYNDNTNPISTLTLDTTGKNLTFMSSIKDNIALVIKGTGTQTLDKAPAYTGSTTVEAGTLQLDAGGTLYNLSGAGTVSYGANALTLSNSADGVYSGVISGSGAVTKTGDKTLTLTGANTFTGKTTVSAGTLKLSGSGKLASTTIDVASGTTLFYDNTVPHNESALTFNVNGGTLEFYNTNYTKTHSIDNGICSGVSGQGVTINGTGATLLIDGGGTVSAIAGTGDSGVTFNLDRNSVIHVKSGMFINGSWQSQVWSDCQAELKIGSTGEVDLWDGSQMKVGGLTGETGAKILNSSKKDSCKGIEIGHGVTADQSYTYNGSIDLTGKSANILGVVDYVGLGTQTFNGDLTKVIMTAQSGTVVLGVENSSMNVGSGSVVKTNGGAIKVDGNIVVNSGQLHASGTWTEGKGTITVNSGAQLRVGGTIGIANGITLAGGLLFNDGDYNGKYATVSSPINITTESSIQCGWTTTTNNVTDYGTLTLTGKLSGSGKFLVTPDSGWVIAGTSTSADNPFTGAVQTNWTINTSNKITQGLLRLAADHPFGDSAGTANIYGTLDMNGKSQKFKGLVSNTKTQSGTTYYKGEILNADTNDKSTLTLDISGQTYTYYGTIAKNIDLVISGENGTQQFNQAPAAASTTVNSGTLELLNNGTLNNLSGSGTVNFGANTLTLYNSSNTTFSGSLVGSGNLIFKENNKDAWIVMDTNGDSFSGNVSLLYDNYTQGAPQGRVKLGRNNAFGLNAGRADIYGSLDMNGYSQTFKGIYSDADKGPISNSSGTLSTLTIDTTNNLTFKSSIKGNIALVITGTGTQTLDKAPEYKGSTTIESGTLVLSNGGELFNLSGGSLDDGGNVIATLDASAHDLTLTNSNLSKFIGSIFATGKQIEKKGDGTLQIYTGANGKVDAQSLVVSSGNLDFKGYMTGSITVNPDTVFSPGNSVGEATFGGGYILKEDATLLIEQDATGMDKLTADTFTIDENSVLDLSFSSVQPGATYPILVQGAYNENDEFVSRNFDGALATDDFWNGLLSEEDAYFWNLKVEGDTVYATLNANAVPEPSTWALLILGAAGLMYWRKRKNA